MNLPEPDQDFLRDLVKASRQHPHAVRWLDRDGTARVTPLSAAEFKRVAALARSLGASPEALLAQAAHLPAAKRPGASRPDGPPRHVRP